MKQRMLFLGTYTQNWALQDFSTASSFAFAHSIDTLLVKVADGTFSWYGGVEGYKNIRNTIMGEGILCIPYIYSYGNTYGALSSEIALLKDYQGIDGVVCADMETEWNGQTGWAATLNSAMTGSGRFLISTWADPDLQNWQGLLSALDSCVTAYMPQQYDDFLASCWTQFGGRALQPSLSMTSEFGQNDPVAIAQQASSQNCEAISIWHYQTAVSNPTLLDQIIAAFPKGGDFMPYTPQSADFSKYFTAVDSDHWTARTGFVVQFGIKAFYQTLSRDGDSLPIVGLPLSNEVYTKVSGTNIVVQKYERAYIVYDHTHVLDSQPGTTDAYLAHIDDPTIKSLFP
jgi:hypothetical protein